MIAESVHAAVYMQDQKIIEDSKMNLSVNESIELKPIDHENAALLFPLLKADLKEIRQWFSINEDYDLENELSYVDEKEPPFDETFVIYYRGTPCGRVGLYDYDRNKNELYMYYWVASPFRRKHVALDSVLTVMDYLSSLGLKSILFDVKKANEASIAMIRQLPNTVLLKEEEDSLIYLNSI